MKLPAESKKLPFVTYFWVENLPGIKLRTEIFAFLWVDWNLLQVIDICRHVEKKSTKIFLHQLGSMVCNLQKDWLSAVLKATINI